MVQKYPSSYFQSLPKLDLHRHIDGDVRPETIFRIAEDEGVELEYDSPEALARHFDEVRENRFQDLFGPEAFGLVTGLMQTQDALETTAYEYVRNCSNDNLIYTEARFAPAYHTGESQLYGHDQQPDPLSYDQIIDAVATGLDRGQQDFDVDTNLIICINREATPDKGVEIAEAAIDNQDKVAGIDLACDEASHPARKHQQAFQATTTSDLYRTVHAGEFGDKLEQNMRDAIEQLDADRLGHARTIARYEELVNTVIQDDIGLEMNPLSNKVCGHIDSIKELRIPELLERGALVSINTDDPEMFGYSLSDTFAALYDAEPSLDEKDFWRFQRNAVEISFAAEETKERLHDRLNKVE